MSSASQKKAIQDYRARLTRRGIARFGVQALESDRELIRSPLVDADLEFIRLREEGRKVDL